MVRVATKVIDGDGHVQEDLAAIATHLPSPYREIISRRPEGLFPPLDHFHSAHAVETPPARDGRPVVGPEGWGAFLDDVGIERTVLYPTRGLAVGHIESLDYAVAATRAYNDWLHDTYVAADPRFNGMALLPMQDPEAAVAELHRAVTELDMRGAMLPSNGLPMLLGSKAYWPVYAEAERLGCCLSIHGGSHDRFGMDHLNRYVPVHALGHPWGLVVNFASVIYNGIFDQFPGVRIAFLEGGVAWLLLCLERFHSSHETHFEHIPPGSFGLREEQRPDRYIIEQIEAGRLFIGCETEELTMPFALKIVGNKPFLYSSDFPHEVTNDSCRHDIGELNESEELSEEDKSGILWRNAERFYRF
ncbi:MAG TPA: amidohydrolase family protein [Acidimicrobiales bacterium]|nr:amidohydrolase family protein [Acidimicrobiales bacterium]